jgi:copper chaperone CopZ
MDIKRGLQIPVYCLGRGVVGANTVERELAATDGVVRVFVNPATATAYVDYDPAETNALVLARAIERAGYQPGRPLEV